MWQALLLVNNLPSVCCLYMRFCVICSFREHCNWSLGYSLPWWSFRGTCCQDDMWFVFVGLFFFLKKNLNILKCSHLSLTCWTSSLLGLVLEGKIVNHIPPLILQQKWENENSFRISSKHLVKFDSFLSLFFFLPGCFKVSFKNFCPSVSKVESEELETVY